MEALTFFLVKRQMTFMLLPPILYTNTNPFSKSNPFPQTSIFTPNLLYPQTP
jgi:hypothetical protein